MRPRLRSNKPWFNSHAIELRDGSTVPGEYDAGTASSCCVLWKNRIFLLYIVEGPYLPVVYCGRTASSCCVLWKGRIFLLCIVEELHLAVEYDGSNGLPVEWSGGERVLKLSVFLHCLYNACCAARMLLG
jgi:hypothetical protein